MKTPLPYRYIAIEGNIGAGKTSLAKIISAKYNSLLVLEEFAENTFLPQFYIQPERFAFPLEMSFLAERYKQLLQAQKKADSENRMLVSDYIFEKSLLFATVNLKGNELELFRNFYDLISPALRQPELIVFLEKSNLVLRKNIRQRGRSYEQNIAEEYLESITVQYRAHLDKPNASRILSIESDQLDFVNNPAHLRYVLRLINTHYNPGIYHIQPRDL
jgi:deoxyadenosine/deoxycytidine kinase